MITQFQYQQVCDELDDTRIMVKALQVEVGELDKEIVELEKENWEFREYQGAWVERLISEGKKVEELEKERGFLYEEASKFIHRAWLDGEIDDIRNGGREDD